tara:strand:- start:957 stop:1223 length:267 start_codon:yes stop_codon:yes gene_type:complete
MVKNPANRLRGAIGQSQIANVKPGCAVGGAVIKPKGAKGLHLIFQVSPKAEILQKTPGRVRNGVSAAAAHQQISAQAIAKNNRKALLR